VLTGAWGAAIGGAGGSLVVTVVVVTVLARSGGKGRALG
jgi:hypothetical protein